MTANTMFSDFQALSGLRTEARNAPEQSLEQVASQFESLFLHMMLKAMREATPKGELFSSSQLDMSQQMFDQQLSVELSRNGGLGLAEILVEQLAGGVTKPGQAREGDTAEKNTRLASLSAGATGASQGAPGWLKAMQSGEMPLRRPLEVAQRTERPDAALDRMGVAEAREPRNWQPKTPEEFIRSVWDHAVNAARNLGVSPEVLVAQSALETGWGSKVIKKSGGDSSFNLFGIKADTRWQGDSATVKTVEFRDGVAVLEKAAFRAYDSLGTAFEDYVDFLQSSPRYEHALMQASDDEGFLNGLQQAGYATDPQYADKILSIIERGNYASVINELKNSRDWSL